MKVTMNMQETLATIQRNQQQIDLLTANNTQLVHFLLSQGMIQNLSELPGFNGNGFTGGMAAFHGPAIPPPLLQAPPNPPAHHARKGSARKQAKRREANATPTPPTSNAGRGQLQAEILIAWAKQAGGRLNLAQFRAAMKGGRAASSILSTRRRCIRRSANSLNKESLPRSVPANTD